MKIVKRDTMHRGFTLIELLIVILIVSIVYFLGFEGLELGKAKPKPLTVMNLKKNIVNSELFDQHATLMCLNKCRTCYLRKDLSSPFTLYPDSIDLYNMKAYVLDNSDSLVLMEYGRYDDNEICLIMEFYDNGSSTQIILENEKGTYFIPSFFGTSIRFESPEEAKEYWITKSQVLSDSGEFY